MLMLTCIHFFFVNAMTLGMEGDDGLVMYDFEDEVVEAVEVSKGPLPEAWMLVIITVVAVLALFAILLVLRLTVCRRRADAAYEQCLIQNENDDA